MLLVVRGSALWLTQGFPQRTWKAESAMTEIIVGDFYVPTPFGDRPCPTCRLSGSPAGVILGYIIMSSRFGT